MPRKQTCNFLTELHVDHQNLESDQNVVFDPRTCVGLSARLHVLNTSNNKMVDLGISMEQAKKKAESLPDGEEQKPPERSQRRFGS